MEIDKYTEFSLCFLAVYGNFIICRGSFQINQSVRQLLYNSYKEITSICEKKNSYIFHPVIFMCSMKLISRGTVEKTWSISALSQNYIFLRKQNTNYIYTIIFNRVIHHKCATKLYILDRYHNNQVRSTYLVIVEQHLSLICSFQMPFLEFHRHYYHSARIWHFSYTWLPVE